MKRREFVLGACVASGSLFLGAGTLSAQKKPSIAERKFRNLPYWTHRAAQRRIDHALDYSQDLRQYAEEAESIDPAEAKLHAEELGRNLSAAQKRVADAKKQAGTDKDAETVKDLDSISKGLSTAADQHAACMEACKQDSVDGKMVMHCCQIITAELQKAKKTYSRVMQRQHPGSPKTKKKSKTKKK